LKTALDLMGICGPTMAPPHLPWNEVGRAALQNELRDLDLRSEQDKIAKAW